MALLTWGEKFIINIKEIDDQHKKLVDLVNELNDAMLLGKGKEILGNILNGVVDYTVYHFAAEDKLFHKYNYPDYLEHKKEHDDLTKQALELKKEFDEGSLLLTIEVMDFLRDWLSNHILQSDKKFGHFLNSKGIL